MRPESVRKKISASMKGKSNFEGKKHDKEAKKKLARSRGHDDRIDGKRWVINKVSGKTNRIPASNREDEQKFGRTLRSFKEMFGEG